MSEEIASADALLVELARLRAQLDAARSVVEAARAYRTAVVELSGLYDADQALLAAVTAYDDTAKARETF